MGCVLCCLIFLAACANENNKDGSQQPDSVPGQIEGDQTNSEQPKQPPAPIPPAELVFHNNSGGSEDVFNNFYGDAIRKKFPQHTIKFIEGLRLAVTQELVAAGTRFDIYYNSIGNFENYAFPLDFFFDMSELVKKHDVDLSRLDSTQTDYIRNTSGGQLYALPVYNSTLILYYNKALFDKFGEDYPTDGMTWDEMVEIAGRMTRLDSNTHYLGYGINPLHMFRLNQMGIPNVNIEKNEPTINTDGRWQSFFQTYFVQATRFANYQDGLKLVGLPNHEPFVRDQTLAMFAYLSNLFTAWQEEFSALDWDMAALPTVSGREGIGAPLYPDMIGITKMAKDKDAAMEVIEYLISDEFQTSLARRGLLPSVMSDTVLSQLGADTVFKDKNWKAFYYNTPAEMPAKALYDAQMINIYTKYGIQVLNDEVDINTALRMAEEEAVKVIEELNL